MLRESTVPVLLAVFLLGSLAACGGRGTTNGGSGGKLRVVATTTQIGDLVRNVGGDKVDVHQILKPNADPHDYEPRPSDVEATAGAGVVFENGDDLDKWMDKVVSEADGDPTIVRLGQGLPERLPGEEASGYDPHWWHDPRNAEAAVREIRDTLAKADPGRKAEFERNAERYLGEIQGLDRGIRACVERVPAGERKLVTDHDAFSYFANRYGLTVVGAVIPSQTTQAQPSAGETAKLIDLIRREGVRAIFPESSLNPSVAEQIARETGASSDYALYGDTLGPEGSSGDTYLKMEAANAAAMVRGFVGGKERCEIGAG